MPRDWSKPTEVDDITMAFPANVRPTLMPSMEEIPEEFTRQSSEWCQWQARWFGVGLKARPLPKPGIDGKMAMRHLHCVQGSYEPKHEHKQAAVAYLASLWFEAPSV